jgi:large conductance mechanosensitive channel
MLEDFKKFIMRGNVLDLAVAVIIGAAFGKIVSSLVDDVIMPLIGLAIGGIDFTGLSFTVGKAAVNYGTFIQNIVDFLVIAFVIFLLIRGISGLEKMRAKPAPAPAVPTTKECPHCLSTVALKATRCPYCTSELA